MSVVEASEAEEISDPSVQFLSSTNPAEEGEVITSGTAENPLTVEEELEIYEGFTEEAIAAVASPIREETEPVREQPAREEPVPPGTEIPTEPVQNPEPTPQPMQEEAGRDQELPEQPAPQNSEPPSKGGASEETESAGSKRKSLSPIREDDDSEVKLQKREAEIAKLTRMVGKEKGWKTAARKEALVKEARYANALANTNEVLSATLKRILAGELLTPAPAIKQEESSSPPPGPSNTAGPSGLPESAYPTVQAQASKGKAAETLPGKEAPAAKKRGRPSKKEQEEEKARKAAAAVAKTAIPLGSPSSQKEKRTVTAEVPPSPSTCTERSSGREVAAGSVSELRFLTEADKAKLVALSDKCSAELVGREKRNSKRLGGGTSQTSRALFQYRETLHRIGKTTLHTTSFNLSSQVDYISHIEKYGKAEIFSELTEETDLPWGTWAGLELCAAWAGQLTITTAVVKLILKEKDLKTLKYTESLNLVLNFLERAEPPVKALTAKYNSPNPPKRFFSFAEIDPIVTVLFCAELLLLCVGDHILV